MWILEKRFVFSNESHGDNGIKHENISSLIDWQDVQYTTVVKRRPQQVIAVHNKLLPCYKLPLNRITFNPDTYQARSTTALQQLPRSNLNPFPLNDQFSYQISNCSSNESRGLELSISKSMWRLKMIRQSLRKSLCEHRLPIKSTQRSNRLGILGECQGWY